MLAATLHLEGTVLDINTECLRAVVFEYGLTSAYSLCWLKFMILRAVVTLACCESNW
jgi:hypothetical protein